jgi:hypothetical protein
LAALPDTKRKRAGRLVYNEPAVFPFNMARSMSRYQLKIWREDKLYIWFEEKTRNEVKFTKGMIGTKKLEQNTQA